MNEQEFTDQFMCNFEPSIAQDYMMAKIEDYFRTTEFMNDRDARSYWIRLFQYEDKVEVQRAKVEVLSYFRFKDEITKYK